MDRAEVRVASGDADCAAWLYRPGGISPAPMLVMGHGLGAVREMRLDAYAERFAAAGFGALVFDYRHFGDSGGEPRQLLDIRRQLEDWASAIAYARGLEGVSSVALWGTSFGGGHVLEAAARDGRVAAVVSQIPFTDGLASMRAADPRAAARLTVLAARDELTRLTGRDPVRVAIAGAPGSTALMTAADALPGVEQLSAGLDVDHTVCARVGSRIGPYRPGRALRRITAPVLMCVADQDSVAPAAAALKHAARAGDNVEVRRYDAGHFDVYWGELFERVVADQLEFLQRHLTA